MKCPTCHAEARFTGRETPETSVGPCDGGGLCSTWTRDGETVRLAAPTACPSWVASIARQRAAAAAARASAAWPVPALFAGATLDAAPTREHRPAYGAIAGWLQDWPDVGPLLLAGAYGCGKSYAAAAVLNALARRGASVAFAPCADLVERLAQSARFDAPEGAEAILARLAAVDCLALDDMAKGRSGANAGAQLFSLIDRRYSARAPIVATFNTEAGRLGDEDVREAIASRLRERACVVKFPAISLRAAAPRTARVVEVAG